MVIVLMGVAGSGKSTIGAQLARDLGWEFHEGDEHHSAANIEKMRRGVALDESDRAPWLEAVRTLIVRLSAEGRNAVVSCSALRRAHRERLALPGVRFVHLRADRHVIAARLADRIGHFFAPELLDSQFEMLEEPDDALCVDAGKPPHSIVQEIRARL